MSDKQTAVNVRIDTQKPEEARNNREAIKAIADTVIFLGGEGLPFRGHEDDTKHHAEVGEQSTNSVGLFICLFNFQVSRGDNVLKKHLSIAVKNARYTSAPIQNQLIECAGKFISNKLVEEINGSGVFAILADESTDCSNKEQMALIIRFHDKNNEIREEFLKCIYMDSGVRGEELKSKILETLRDAGIDMSYCRGQGCDGAANMSGVRCGSASLVTTEYPLAIYMHCVCHKLNLVIQKTWSVQMVRNIMNTIKQLSYFLIFHLSAKERLKNRL